MLKHNLVLKSDELFLAGDITHDETDEPATGLYLRDTRHLHHWELTLGGAKLQTLAVRESGPEAAVVYEANPVVGLGADRLLPLTLGVEHHITLTDHLEVVIFIENHASRPVRLPLVASWSADFRDLFDIRGFRRIKRGRLHAPESIEGGVELSYTGLDGRRIATRVRYDRPAHLKLTPPGEPHELEEEILLPGHDRTVFAPEPQPVGVAEATFDLDVPAGGKWSLRVSIEPVPALDRPVAFRPPTSVSPGVYRAIFSTDNELFNRLLTRSFDDLQMLQATFPEGSLPAAGVPWYVAPFGRDSLIVGLQTVHSAPRRAVGILRVLAAHQGTKTDPWRDEEPGRILHEVRYGEMSRTGEIPHTPYYGTVDATPLFVLLFAETVAWTNDRTLYDELKPNVLRALEWIDGPGDPDRDGLVEYVSRVPDGVHIVHQGWKDSSDSLNHAGGRPAADGPIALVEVQGYVYAACRRLAEVARRRGDAAWADRLDERTERMRALVEERFWIDAAGTYAQALDGEKQPVEAITSNPGHLLYCGLPSRDRAARVAHRLTRPDLFSGWGIRTLSSEMPTYNPMSYHNGSVWPHDNSLIAAGLRRYGFTSELRIVADGLFEAALADPLARLPELFCGYERVAGDDLGPVPYPVSCSPQAWAAAAVPLLLRSVLGLELDLDGDVLILDPALPEWLNEVTAHGLPVRGETVSFTLRRRGSAFDIQASGPVRLR